MTAAQKPRTRHVSSLKLRSIGRSDCYRGFVTLRTAVGIYQGWSNGRLRSLSQPHQVDRWHFVRVYILIH